MTASSTFLDRARMTVASAPGAGQITLGAAVSGFNSFAGAGAVDGATVSYQIEDGSNWEYGRGTYTASGTKLSRDVIFGSSNSGSAITASANAIVTATLLAEDLKSNWQNILNFGADNTGSNDCTTALNKALATLPATGGVIYFPPGVYKFLSQVTFNYGTGFQCVSLIGAGMDATELYWNSGSGINFVLQSNQNAFRFSDLTIATNTGVTTNTGLTLAWSTSVAPTTYLNTMSVIERVSFRGHGANTGPNFWGTCVALGTSYVNFDSCMFNGYTKQGIGVTIQGQNVTGNTNGTTSTSQNVLNFAATPVGIINGMFIIDNANSSLIGLNAVTGQTGTTVTMSANANAPGVGNGDQIVFLTYAVNINFDKCGFNNLSESVVIGDGAQGITFTETTFVGCAIGVFSDGASGVSEIWVGSGCEFACSEWGVLALANNGTSGGHDDGVYVTGALFFSTDTTGTFPCIYSTFSNTVICGNNFEGVSGALAIFAGGGFGAITGNNFLQFSTGTNFASTSSSFFLGGNNYVLVTTRMTNTGSNPNVGTQYNWMRGDESYQPIALAGGQYRNLKVTNGATAATQIAVTADWIALHSSSQGDVGLSAVSVTINTGSSGANGLDTGSLSVSTWYNVFIIYNGTTVAGLISLSATAPTLPSGYNWFTRVGAMRNGASGGLLASIQFGTTAQYVLGGNNVATLPQIGAVSQGSVSTPTYVSKAVANFVPPTASKIKLLLQATANSANAIAIAATSTSYGGGANTTKLPPLTLDSDPTAGGVFGSVMGDMLLESSNIQLATGSAAVVNVLGWEDNL